MLFHTLNCSVQCIRQLRIFFNDVLSIKSLFSCKKFVALYFAKVGMSMFLHNESCHKIYVLCYQTPA